MKFADAQLAALIERGDLIKVNGRWYLAYDLAAPAMVAASYPHGAETIAIPILEPSAGEAVEG